MIALLEALDRDGAVRQAWRVERWPLSIGRGLDNDAVLTDPHVAAHHATITVDASGAVTVAAGETRNGIGVGRSRVAGGASQTFADSGRDLDLHVGRTALRLRLPSHAIAAEQALAPLAGGELRALPTLGGAALVLVGVLASTWLATDPGNLARQTGVVLLSTVATFVLWCGAWALVSKLFARQSHFGWHVRVAVGAALLLLVLSAVPALVAFAFSWPWLTDFAFVAVYATIAVAIYFHLLAVEPAKKRLMRGVAATGFVTAVALAIWFNVQRTGRPGEELYMNHLFPPMLRVAPLKPVDGFIASLPPMQAILDRQARQPGGDDSADDLEKEEQ